ncbi:MAG: hypothetical protein KAJ29_07230 [Alphaproteobacteria bacterium]|nr:hypothetical protein [Alphaproteobacteria bacterium]
MVDLIGPAANQISSATGMKGMDSVQAEREKVSPNTSISSEAIDEVSFSDEAMDLGRVMEIVEETKAYVESDLTSTLSNDAERLNMLV